MNRALTVLGMHRSGTSMLIGSLREVGVYLGSVHDTVFEHNRKGLLEPKSILYMQEDLLKVNGGSWSDPPAQVVWQPLHQAVRDLFIESRAGHPIWGFKDPRTVHTLEGWQNALPGLELCGIFRHPLEVAESMQLRNGFSLQEGMAIWKRYNERMLAIHKKSSFPMIEFVSDPVMLREKLARTVAALRLPVQLPSADFAFFEEGLRRHDAAAEQPLPDDIDKIYRELQALAL